MKTRVITVIFDFSAADCEICNVYSGAGAANGFGHSLSIAPNFAAADKEDSSGVKEEGKAMHTVVQAVTPARAASSQQLGNSDMQVQCTSHSMACAGG